ncbi:hypothetical protein B296_00047716 [Ensete ventricosum]|uniref:Uncharacterized protein n=1 Tax=Ensete ventricosum TaxID=4639 RepID=A0A426WZT0_ENSVE|nr:hypothetical protein B296_00047716 [Ensete ventricosum]
MRSSSVLLAPLAWRWGTVRWSAIASTLTRRLLPAVRSQGVLFVDRLSQWDEAEDEKEDEAVEGRGEGRGEDKEEVEGEEAEAKNDEMEGKKVKEEEE